MAACSIFEEDEVFIFDEKGYRCGLVLESAEYASSDEEDDPMDFTKFDYERVQKGTVRVAWHPDGEEQVVQENKLKLADRSLMPGDVVRRLIQGQDSQRGYVRNTKVTCHLQLLAKSRVIANVPSTDLEPITPWDTEPGDVTYESWVGKLENVNEEVTLTFPDGASCKVCEDEFINELFRFEDVTEKRNRDSEFAVHNYYPGQQFRGSLGDLESAQWIKTTSSYSPGAARLKQNKEITVTVTKVDVKSVDVHWLCRGYAKMESPLAKMEPPPRRLQKHQLDRLKKLDCFEACSVQIGDKAFYTIKNIDVIETVAKSSPSPLHTIMKKSENVQDLEADQQKQQEQNAKNSAQSESAKGAEPSETIQDGSEAAEAGPGANGVEPAKVEAESGAEPSATAAIESRDDSAGAVNGSGPAEVETLVNGVDVDSDNDDSAALSDTASTASNISSASASSVSSLKKKGKSGAVLQTKLMKKKRLRRARKKPSQRSRPEAQAGDRVPVEVMYTSTMVEVMWQDGTIEQNIPSVELFPIHHLDDLEFFPGDMVIRNSEQSAVDDNYGVVECVSHADRTCMVRWMKPYTFGKGNKPDESICAEEMSVYDIKDHPDYKFRPGHVVVRVGGYEETHDVAAGQVCELGKDGRLQIRWADGTHSNNYPQELYLIGDELAELGSDLESSSEESEEGSEDGDDAPSDVSWETEEEEVMIGTEDENQGGGGSSTSLLSVEPCQKIELDQLLETARSTLQKLEDTFAQNVDIGPIIVHCYREILRINRNCRDLNKMLDATYFNDPKLINIIGTIRKELKREQASSMARQVLELFETNCRLEGKAETKGEAEGQVEVKGSDKAAAEPDAKGDSQKEAEVKGESGATAEVKDAATGEGNVEKSGEGATAAADAPTSKHGKGCSSKAKDLCQTACRLLKEQIVQVHDDLEKKWQELKEAGRLRVVGEEDEDSDSDEFPLNLGDGGCSTAATTPGIPTPGTPSGAGDSIPPPTPDGKAPGRPGLGLDLTITTQDMAEEARKASAATPQTPAEIRAKILCNVEGFTLDDSVPESHRFYSAEHQPSNPQAFFSAVRKEMKLFRTSLPIGIFVKGFEDRMDLYSVMIKGPVKTPYEDGLFFFDVQLPNDYPTSPPIVQYLSFCMDRLNPNLYEDGKVCVSLLGTWAGKGTEVWHNKSSLLQVLISIQGLILVDEPYYNEAGYEKQKGSQQGQENSRMYNEMAICKMVQSLTRMCQHPPPVWELEVLDHLRQFAERLKQRMRYYILKSDQPSRSAASPTSSSASAAETTSSCSSSAEEATCSSQLPAEATTNSSQSDNPESSPPDSDSDYAPVFPLLPASRGFCLTLDKNLREFEAALASLGFPSSSESV